MTNAALEENMKTSKPTCGAKNRSGGACARPAGWGTPHPGTGRCKLHGGSVPTGSDSPLFKHGLYSKHITEEQRIELEEFRSRLEWFAPSDDEIFILYRVMKLLTEPGHIPPMIALVALEKLSGIKKRYKEIMQGVDVNVHLTNSECKRLVDATITVLSKYVPDQNRENALAEFRSILTTDAQLD